MGKSFPSTFIFFKMVKTTNQLVMVSVIRVILGYLGLFEISETLVPNPVDHHNFAECELRHNPFSDPDHLISTILRLNPSLCQWEFQDPTDGGTLVPYFWPYFVGIFPENRPFIGLIYGRYLQFRFLRWPVTLVSKTLFRMAQFPIWVGRIPLQFPPQ